MEGPKLTWKWLDHVIGEWARKGVKRERGREAYLIREFIRYCRSQGVHDPSQISRRLAHQWCSLDRREERLHAVMALWEILRRKAFL